MTTVKCIMLVDDSDDDNFFSSRVIRKGLGEDVLILTKYNGKEAINYLRQRQETNEPKPDLILLDINMPVMNGWDFLHEYEKLAPELQGSIVVIMLTTSANPDDVEKARSFGITASFKSKPLTEPMLHDILQTYHKVQD